MACENYSSLIDAVSGQLNQVSHRMSCGQSFVSSGLGICEEKVSVYFALLIRLAKNHNPSFNLPLNASCFDHMQYAVVAALKEAG
jgi:hypothetical protein